MAIVTITVTVDGDEYSGRFMADTLNKALHDAVTNEQNPARVIFGLARFAIESKTYLEKGLGEIKRIVGR